jgi:hypothetical protein
VEGVSSKSRTYVTVVCLQQSSVVYQWSANPDFAFPLQDQAGQGLEWDGGSANCSGTLINREDKGRKITIRLLDDAPFSVDGASG